MVEDNGYDVYEDYYYDEETGARVSNISIAAYDATVPVKKPENTTAPAPAQKVADKNMPEMDEVMACQKTVWAAYLDSCRRFYQKLQARIK